MLAVVVLYRPLLLSSVAPEVAEARASEPGAWICTFCSSLP